ncbi:MAG TPA: hypothetical protein VFR87_10735 [Nocardioidaceae bacterium]|nr:hypothetical protein [Nocardioidaceae bacterium]
MTRYADPERCPDCLAAMPFGTSRCPSCGLSLEGPMAAELFSTLSHADDLLVSMRTATTAPATAPGAAAATAPAAGAAAGPAAAGVETEPGLLATMTRPAPPVPGGPGLPPHDDHRHEGHPHGGLGGASVPKILLGLGALCLLVAALVFLAVTWSAMGVAGRTATLVGFTVLAGGLTAWAARRDLRAAAESLGVVALGLLSFDLFGARDAGWLGDITTAEFFVLLGTVVALAGAGAATAVRRTPASALVGAEVIAALGLLTAMAGGVGTEWFSWDTGMTLAVLVAAAVAFAANRVRLTVLSVGAGMLALGAWMVLAMSALERALTHPSLQELWLDLEVWPLLVTALLAAGLVLVRGLPSAVRIVALGVAVLVLAVAIYAPVDDEPLTERALTAAVLLVAVAGLALVVPQPWRRTLAVPGSVGLAWSALAAVSLSTEAVLRLLEQGADLWTEGAGDSFAARAYSSWEMAGWLLPVLVLAIAASLVAAARSFSWVDRAVAPLADLDVLLAVVAGTTALTLALYPVPIWLVLAVLLAAGVGFVVRWERGQRTLPLAPAALFLAPALQLSLHARWLTLAAAAVLLIVSTVVHLRARQLEVSVSAGVVVPVSLAGLVWTIGAIAESPAEWVAVVAILALAALALGGPYVDERLRVSGPATTARLGLELGALAATPVVSIAGMNLADGGSEATWAAVYLTLVGAAVSATALLRQDRRAAGWLGGLLLAAASWVRLADLGVDTPEAYTLPSAVALVALGLYHLRANPAAGTMAALTPGLMLALVPSLLWVFADPVALRSLLLGMACLALVVTGVRLRWSAPLVHGAVVGALLVVRHATPVAEAVPRWALIGAAGALLVAMGITWEARVRDARRVAGYVRGLR